MANEKTMLVGQWMKECRAAADAHYDAARYSERMHLFFGLSAAILAAFVGCGIVLTLNSSPEFWQRATAVLLTVLSVVFAAVQTFSNFSLRAADHKTAACRFDEIRRSCEASMASGKAATEDLDPIQKMLDNANEAAVSVPERFKERNPCLQEWRLSIQAEATLWPGLIKAFGLVSCYPVSHEEERSPLERHAPYRGQWQRVRGSWL